MSWFYIALASSLLSAFAAVTQKQVLIRTRALEFSFVLSLVNLLFSVPLFFMTPPEALTSSNMWVLFIKSVINAAAFLCVMQALKNLEISNALPLLALTPGFIALFAFLFLGEDLSLLEVTGLLLLTAGTYILEAKNLKGIFPLTLFFKSKYHRYILSALLLFTAASILDKVLLVKLKMPPVSLIAFQHLYFAGIFGIVYLAYYRFGGESAPEKLFNFTKRDMLWVALISVLTIGYRYTQVLAVAAAPVALVIAIKRTSVIWATVFGGMIFKDANLARRIAAAVLILAGALLILRD